MPRASVRLTVTSTTCHDIVMLVQTNKIDLAAPEDAATLDRHASPTVRAEIQQRLAGPESAGV